MPAISRCACFPATLFLVSLLLGQAAAAAGAPPDGPPADAAAADRIAFVRDRLAAGALRPAYVTCDSLRRAGVATAELIRLEGDVHWLAASAGALAVADTLRARGDDLAADILLLKIDLLLGRPDAAARLAALEARAPGHPDLRLARWLLALDGGDWDAARRQVDAVADAVACAYVPPTALLLAAVDRDSAAAADAAGVLARRGVGMLAPLRRKLEAGALFGGACAFTGTRELPYVACGPYPGLRLTAADGRQLTLSIDTGTGHGAITVHREEPGAALPGPELVRIPDGIRYHYMPAAADVVIKSVPFSDPPVRRPVEYFAGEMEGKDGCVSPFAFPGAALTVDARAGRIWQRDRRALADYVAALDPDSSAVVPFVRRAGWIYLPVRLDGHEVLAALESGSRDVCVNTLAARRLGIGTYEGTVMWRGEEHPVTRADVTVEIGGFTYRCADAMVGAFVPGNNLTGLASACDLGPDFLRNFRWTVDPFADRLILERLAEEEG